MTGFNYENFKTALAAERLKKEQELKEDIKIVKQTLENWLEKVLNSSAMQIQSGYGLSD